MIRNSTRSLSLIPGTQLLKPLGSALWVGGFPGGTSDKESACHAGDTRDMGSIPESGKSPGEGHSNHSSILGNGSPLQYSCLRNPMGRRTWWAIVHGVAKPLTRLSHWAYRAHKHTRAHIHTLSLSLSLSVIGCLLHAKEMTGGWGLLYSFRMEISHQKPWLEGGSFQPYLPALKGEERGEVGVNHQWLMASWIIPT